MQIFEYPYIIITIFVFCFIGLGAVGIYFAIRGAKTAKDSVGKDFTNISKIESSFKKSGTLRENRCVLYVGVSLDNFSGLYTKDQETHAFSDIKSVTYKATQGIFSVLFLF